MTSAAALKSAADGEDMMMDGSDGWWMMREESLKKHIKTNDYRFKTSRSRDQPGTVGSAVSGIM
jgi:thermostable 8-oxoguanine DNA glycosylase